MTILDDSLEAVTIWSIFFSNKNDEPNIGQYLSPFEDHDCFRFSPNYRLNTIIFPSVSFSSDLVKFSHISMNVESPGTWASTLDVIQIVAETRLGKLPHHAVTIAIQEFNPPIVGWHEKQWKFMILASMKARTLGHSWIYPFYLHKKLKRNRLLGRDVIQ